MKYSTQLEQFLKGRESFSPVAIQPLPGDDWTYGWGFTIKSNGTPVQEGDVITTEEAETQFQSLLQHLSDQLSTMTPEQTVTQYQFDATLSLVYNIGLHAFATSTTGHMYHLGQDISKRFDLWDEFHGQVSQGLLNRREMERKLYETGDYQL